MNDITASFMEVMNPKQGRIHIAAILPQQKQIEKLTIRFNRR